MIPCGFIDPRSLNAWNEWYKTNPWQNICDPFWQNKNKVAGKLTRLLINTSPGGHFNNSMFLIFSHPREISTAFLLLAVNSGPWIILENAFFKSRSKTLTEAVYILPAPYSKSGHSATTFSYKAIKCLQISSHLIQSSEVRWPSWAFRPNKPYGFCGRKATLTHALALVTVCP